MPELLASLLEFLEIYRPAFTAPSFANMIVIFAGWVQSNGTHAVTEALVVTGVSARRHHEAYHRFFSRGTWSADELGRLLFGAIVRVLAAEAPVRIAVDDTLAPKKGRHVFGIGSHLDAVRSTKRFRVFCFGHCWVVLAVLVPVPFSSSARVWALPVLFRLYRNKKECAKKAHPYRKKTELAREMLDLFLTWVAVGRIELAADSAYCNDTVTRDLPARMILLGSMRPDAVLTALPEAARGKQGGRPRKRGEVLAKPEVIGRDGRRAWKTCDLMLYGKREHVHYKECVGQWYRACGTRLLRVVIVWMPKGAIDLRVFFSTDAAMSVEQILEGYAGRWSIETTFKNLKQLLGFADSQARKKQAVERTAPFVGLMYTMLVLWFAQRAHATALAAPPIRPWYRHKRGFSFADVLRTAQRVLAPLDVLDPRRGLANLHQLRSRRAPPSSAAVRRAA